MGHLDRKQVTGLFSEQCGRFNGVSNIANTCLARDYKGFGNQPMNGVIETGYE